MAALFKPCSVETCKGNANHSAKGARGYCHKHYRRWQRHGSAMGGGTEYGEPDRFIAEVANHWASDECLIWPYSRNNRGYGQISRGGRPKLVHRIVCEVAHGSPPPDHQAAHSCGKGHEGCVNPRHLRWATTSENMLDRTSHGTDNRGERQGSSKLTKDDVLAIRASNARVTDLARSYGVSPSTICGIQSGRTWAWLITANGG